MWEPFSSYHNGLFSPLFVIEISLLRGWSVSVLTEQNGTSYLFYVTSSFLCNIICYLISVFVFSLVTLSGDTTVSKCHRILFKCFLGCQFWSSFGDQTYLLFRKKITGSLMNYKELISLLQTKVLVLTIQKRGVVWMKKKDLEESIRRKTSLGRTYSIFRQEYSE